MAGPVWARTTAGSGSDSSSTNSRPREALMLPIVLAAALTGMSPDPDPNRAAAGRELFANEGWYQEAEGKEQAFVGVLRRVDRGAGVAGFGRYNPYRLHMDGGAVREVYVGGQLDVLTPYVDKKIRLTGKAVDMEVEG